MPSTNDHSLFDWDETSSSKRSRFSDTSSVTHWKRTYPDPRHEVDDPERSNDVATASPGALMPALSGPLFPLVVAFSALVSFGLAAAFMKLGCFLLQYKAEKSVLRVKCEVTPAFAEVTAVGCAVVNGAGCVLVLLVARLLDYARRSWQQGFFWALSGLTVVAGVFVTAVGLVFLPGQLGPDGLSLVQALQAGSLGFGVVAVGLGLVSLLLFAFLCRRNKSV